MIFYVIVQNFFRFGCKLCLYFILEASKTKRERVMKTPIMETEQLKLRPFHEDDAKEELQLSEIVGRYAVENPASGNVMKKLGFVYEKNIPYECNEGSIKREGIQCRLHVNRN